MSWTDGSARKEPEGPKASQLVTGNMGTEGATSQLVAGNIAALSNQLEGLNVSQHGNETHCSICHEQYVHPVQLPCKHSFCYLCIKGAVARSGRCALCRRAIPTDYLERPGIVDARSIEAVLKKGDTFQWFYEARNGGWWMYEERTSQEIEKAHVRNEEKCIVQILGYNYTVDFKENVQYREDIPTRRRKIKRDKVAAEGGVKGVAGVWLPPPAPPAGTSTIISQN